MLILKALRKLFAIALLCLFGLSFASPLLSQVGMMRHGDMPACCRKAAKHHCASMDGMENMQGMDDMAMDDASPAEKTHDHLSAPMTCCGCCGFMASAGAHATVFFVPAMPAAITPRSTRANLAPQRTLLLMATWQQSGNKRGPPAAHTLRNV